MSGTYAGLQAKIKKVNALEKFVPFSAHSLNLVGINAVDCCTQVVFFMIYFKTFIHFSQLLLTAGKF